MRRNLKACLSIFRIRTAEALQYRAAALASASVGIFWALLEVTIYTIFYRYGSLAGNSSLTLPQAITYVWLAQALFPLQPLTIDQEIINKIISGDVGVELCRPLDLYSHWLAKTAAGRLGAYFWRAAITVLVGVLLPDTLGLGGPASPFGFCLFLLSAACSFLLCASYGMLVTAVRLGITWGEGPTLMLLLLGAVLSGAYLPLQLWPDFLQKLLYLQPFAGHLDLPVRLYVGSMSPSEAARAIALQLLWTAIFVALGRLILRARLRNVIIQGG